MRLRRLEVFGFKSFFDKTVITFQKGITGIVGPNGCGKSNFADAIHWVLGEQSPKNLRGERMEDVIFSGTEKRKPLSVAEVSLTIGDISNELPPPYTPYAELTLSRRLYRSGESEYLINKTPCRLKDIRDLLIDIGAGYRAHTIIEQGKVDDLITASPMQRREIVEEAAGIAKYRLRKAEALRKLEATERNLTRVSDIIGEIKRQRNALDRQARKAEKCQALNQSLKTVDLKTARYEWLGWSAEQKTLEEEEATLQKTSAAMSAQLAALETEQSTHKLALVKKEETLAELGHQISGVERDVQRCEGKIALICAQRQEWRETDSRTDQEIKGVEHGITSLASEETTLGEEMLKITQTLPRLETALSTQEGKKHDLERKVFSENADLDQGKVALFDLASRLTTSKNNLIHFQTRQESLLKQKTRLRFEQEATDKKSEVASATLEKVREQYQNTRERIAALNKKQSEISEILKKTEEAIRSKEEQLLRVREDWTDIKAQVASHEGFYRGFLKKGEGSENRLLQLEGLQGMVADLIDVPSRYELALEAVLENRLRGIVVENHAEIQKGITHLRHTEMGRGIFFPRKPRTFRKQEEDLLPNKGLIGRALDLVTVRSGYEEIAEALLGGIVIMTDLEVALAAWKTAPAVTSWVTLAGEVVDRSGIVSGGEQGERGLLGQKRELLRLTDLDRDLQEKVDLLYQEIETCRKMRERSHLEIETLSETARLLDVEQIKKQNEEKTLSYEVERLQEAHQTTLFEQEEGEHEEETLIKAEAEERFLMSESERLMSEKKVELEKLKTVLSEHRQSLEQFNEEVILLKLETNSLKEKEQHTQEKQLRVRREKDQLTTRLEEMALFKKSLQKKMSTGVVEESEATAAIETLSAVLSTHLESIRKVRESHAVLFSQRQAMEKEISSLRSELSLAQETLQKIALKKVTVEMNLQKIEETALTRYQTELATYSDVEGGWVIEEARAEAEALRQKLDQIGPVNLAAIEEYKELDTRFQFLSDQESDLTHSMEGLREAINKINKTTRGLFVETFHSLNQKFGEVYTAFFGGGSAELVLLDEAHPLESGIEMLAQPPGKGKRNILLLSGGEKALTAISLLFATFLIHPTPFCLLDEIDAPLDEENTRRFSQTLVKMSDQTQFIVVTHNKFTMEIADVLYGVTMEETGISKLISVNLKTPKDSPSETIAPAVS